MVRKVEREDVERFSLVLAAMESKSEREKGRGRKGEWHRCPISRQKRRATAFSLVRPKHGAQRARRASKVELV
jgi:hypothetical protein